MQRKDLMVLIGALCAAIALTVSQFLGNALETGSWGLCFRTEGQLPTGPASMQELKKYDAAYAEPTAEKVLYLTFDAGCLLPGGKLHRKKRRSGAADGGRGAYCGQSHHAPL